MTQAISETRDATLDLVAIYLPREIRAYDLALERLNQCREFLQAIPDRAERKELADTLQDGLLTIAGFHRSCPEKPELYGDSAPLSFTWRAGGFFGGLLFHGAHDGFGSGAAPTLAVTLTPAYGWRIHT